MAANLGAPFALAFLVLLVFAASFLCVNMSFFADLLANFAFISLFVGVAFQLVSFFRCKRTAEEAV